MIFLSHHSAEKPTLRRLAARLTARGLGVWLDEREIEPLEELSEKVLEGLRSSRFFLAWWFGEFGNSPACQFEFITALASAEPQAAAGQILVVGPEAILSDAALGRLKAVKLPILPADPSDAELEALAEQLHVHIAGHLDAQTFGDMGLRVARSDEPADPRFVGRARELLELHARLWADAPGVEGQGAAQALVSGLGGQGKTLLAREYARRFAVAYPGGVLRLDLPGDAASDADIDREIDTALLKAAQGLNRDTGKGTRAELRGALRYAFSGNAPYLWVVDNVPGRASAAQVAALRAPTGFGTTLFTARARLPGIDRYPLGQLRPTDALRLLHRIATTQEGPTYPPERLEPLITHVHGHALSLALLGHALADGFTPETLLAQVKATPMAGLERLMENYEADEDEFRPVLATLRTTLDRLPVAGPPATSRALLGLLTHLAAGPVPVALLQEALGEAGLAAAQRPLYRLGLIDRDTRAAFPGGAEAEVINLHPLLAEVVTLQTGFTDAAPVANWLTGLDAALLADMRAIAEDASHHHRDPVSGWLLPHTKLRAEVKLELRETDLGFWAGRALHETGDLHGARALQEQVSEARYVIMGPEHPDTLTSLNNLSETFNAQGSLTAARALVEQVLEARCRILGPEHPDTLTSMNNLGQILSAQGDLPGAYALLQDVLDARSRILGLEHPHTLISLNNLALSLIAQGDFASAGRLQAQGLDIFRRNLGLEHPGTLIYLNNFALTLFAQGDFLGARALQEQVLEVRSRILGPEHPEMLASLNNLAGTVSAQGDLPWARALQERALEASYRTLGPEHLHTLTSMNNLAGTLSAGGDMPRARALQERVREIRERTLGLEHPDTLTSINNLASTLWALGDLPGAQALQEQALAVRRRILGAEHPDALRSMNNLALTLWAQGDLMSARVLQEQGLEACHRTLGLEHPDTLTSMNNLASTLRTQGELPRARTLEEEVLKARRRTLGPEHPDTLGSLNNLALTLHAQSDLPAARALIAPVLALIPTLQRADVRNALTDTARTLNLPLPGDPT